MKFEANLVWRVFSTRLLSKHFMLIPAQLEKILLFSCFFHQQPASHMLIGLFCLSLTPHAHNEFEFINYAKMKLHARKGRQE